MRKNSHSPSLDVSDTMNSEVPVRSSQCQAGEMMSCLYLAICSLRSHNTLTLLTSRNCFCPLCSPFIVQDADMAANYWASTQRRHWQFTKDQLSDIREKLEDDDRGFVQQYPLPNRRLLSIFFNQRTLLVSFLERKCSSPAILESIFTQGSFTASGHGDVNGLDCELVAYANLTCRLQRLASLAGA